MNGNTAAEKYVVVGIDGGTDGARAMRYAVEEAQRQGAGVRIVHVFPQPYTFAAGAPMVVTPDPRQIGEEILAEAVAEARALAPDLPVQPVLAGGHRATAILDNAQDDAAAVVIGTREWRFVRAFGGSTTFSAARHAHCPVFAVPPTWDPEVVHGQVVVGVDDQGEPADVLRHALLAARERGAGLRVVHVWDSPLTRAYEPVFLFEEAVEWRAATQDLIAKKIDPVIAEFPDVAVQVEVDPTIEKSGFAELAKDCDLIVLGRHRAVLPMPVPRLGSIVHHAIHAGDAPVQIIPITVSK